MKPRANNLLTSCVTLVASLILAGTTAQAQQIQVTAADPAAGEQGTVNLNVKVTGKGFKNGARAKWFVTGTIDPGGVTVNSTTFVSSTELTANITVSDTAVIANFDIQVLNSDGRGGKGTELFRVTAKGQSQCPPIQPAPTSDTRCYDALPGCLDSTFGGVGFMHTDPDAPEISNSVSAVVVQPDGKIVTAGRGQFPNTTTSFDFVVVRYNGDGSLDTSFGDVDPLNPPLRRGYSVTYISNGADFANGLLLQPDGKIVVVGSANSGEMAAVRYNVDGTPDSSFGSGGKVLVTFGAKISAVAQGAALQSDGKIVMGGRADTQFALARLDSSGSLDSSFGTSGKLMVNPSGARSGINTALDVALQRVPAMTGEERIVLAGQSRTSSQANREWTLMRFKPNGATDTTFGTSGIVKTSFFGFGESAMRVAIDSSNQIIATGFVYSSDPSQCNAYIQDAAVVRYTQNGALDPSFGGDGKQTLDVYGGRDEPYGLALQTDGKIVMAGFSMSSDITVQHILVVRLNVDGSLDSSFGPSANGIVTTAADRIKTVGYALALQPWDGKIVVAGSGWNGGNGNPTTIVVARYLP